jgi:hypothetical protein
VKELSEEPPAKISPHYQAYKVKMRIACMQPTEMQPVLNLTNNVVSDEFLIWWSNNLRCVVGAITTQREVTPQNPHHSGSLKAQHGKKMTLSHDLWQLFYMIKSMGSHGS